MIRIFKRDKKIGELNANVEIFVRDAKNWLKATRSQGIDSPRAKRIMGRMDNIFEQTEELTSKILDGDSKSLDSQIEAMDKQIADADAVSDKLLQRMDETLGFQEESDEEIERKLAEIMAAGGPKI